MSRGASKLAGFVREFRVDFRGAVVLDIGSSTGGWTELALACGAKRVIAVEKGTRQMRAPLRFDPRVELHEKTDIFEFVVVDKPDVIMADVSFVSLRPVLKYAREKLVRRGTRLIVLCKPQFEASPEQLVDGVVKNEKMRREILREFEGWMRRNGLVVRAKRDSETRGRFGNLERLYLLTLEGLSLETGGV
jgi:23S rRNA (cytidine1920-2'-O)/16S rRNA (cytidine1409-2'-O)-methyltransferase